MNQPISDLITKQLLSAIRKEISTRKAIDGGLPTVMVAPDVYDAFRGYFKWLSKHTPGTDDFGEPLDELEDTYDEKLSVFGVDVLKAHNMTDRFVAVVPHQNVDQLKNTWGVKDEPDIDGTSEHVVQGTEDKHGRVPGGSREDVRGEGALVQEAGHGEDNRPDDPTGGRDSDEQSQGGE